MGNEGAEPTGNSRHPVACISWRDAVIWCNALSEMTGLEAVYVANGTNGTTDGELLRTSVANAYGGANIEDVVKSEAETITRKGYRLPTSIEWEYAARYRGSDQTNVVTGVIDGYDFSNPSQGIYYTKGNSASGATTYYNDATGTPPAGKLANDSVAVYRYFWNGSSWEELPDYLYGTKEVAGLTDNALGLYDMSGNMFEFCFTPNGSKRIIRSGCWDSAANGLQVGVIGSESPNNYGIALGFRLARTQ
jgi:formylglycine-generating enzyme required for sulfatase activity